jgi:hypothetical protein
VPLVRTIVFSRDRAAQLDLLLRSLARNGRLLFDEIVVLLRSTSEESALAYDLVALEHSRVRLVEERRSFAEEVYALLPEGGYVLFLTDDDVLYGRVDARPLTFLGGNPTVATFSLRLGVNTRICYPYRREQELPPVAPGAGVVMSWRWNGADGDFGYPLSLDGHLFRAADVHRLLDGADFSNPNELEGALARRAPSFRRPLMASYRQSRLVSIPTNRVTETPGNRFGESFPSDPRNLNERFLAGERLDLDGFDFARVEGAHHELPLVFTGKSV